MSIQIRRLEQHPTGTHLEANIDDTRITADTRGTRDVTIEDGHRVVRVTLDDTGLIDDVDVIDPE